MAARKCAPARATLQTRRADDARDREAFADRGLHPLSEREVLGIVQTVNIENRKLEIEREPACAGSSFAPRVVLDPGGSRK